LSEKKYSVLVIGDALIDNQYFVEALPSAGDDERIISQNKSTGGSAANTAITLAKLGIDCSFCGRIGNDDNGRMIKQQFEESGVDTTCLQYGDSTGYTLAIVDESGERTMLSFRGASGQAIDFTKELEERLSDTKILLISGYLLTDKEQSKLVRVAIDVVKNSGVIVAFDPSPVINKVDEQLLKDILNNTDILLPNRSEILTITGKSDLDSALNALSIPCIAVKLGSEGAMLIIKSGFYVPDIKVYNDDRVCISKTKIIKAVDTTGAGDAFNAGFIASVLNGDNVEKLLENGNDIALKAVLRIGAV